MYRAINRHLRVLHSPKDYYFIRHELFNHRLWLGKRASFYYNEDVKRGNFSTRKPSQYVERYKNAVNAMDKVIKVADYVNSKLDKVSKTISDYYEENKTVSHVNMYDFMDLVVNNYETLEEFTYVADRLRHFYRMAEKAINLLEKTECRISNVNDYSLELMKIHMESYQALLLILDACRKIDIRE